MGINEEVRRLDVVGLVLLENGVRVRRSVVAFEEFAFPGAEQDVLGTDIIAGGVVSG